MSEPIHHAVYALRNSDGNLLSLKEAYGQLDNWVVPYSEADNEDLFKQLWLLVDTKTGHSPTRYYLRCLTNASHLNLEPDCTYGENINGRYSTGWKQHNGQNQQWTLESKGDDQYTIWNVQYGTPLDTFSDKGNKWIGACNSHGGASQIWTLERRSRGRNEINAMIDQHPMCQGAGSGKYNQLDGAYVTLPNSVRQAIWERTGLKESWYRREIFDCEDFMFVFKAEVSKWSREHLMCQDISILMGLYAGGNERGGHAFNWYLSQDLKSLKWFEPQNSKEDDNAQGYHMWWMIA